MTMLVFSLLTASIAQTIPTAANPSDVEVLKYSWHRLNGAVASVLAPPIAIDGVPTGRRPPGEREKYEYKIRFKNTGSKTVKRIVWVYVFADPATNKELTRRRFKSDLKLAPNAEKEQTEIGNWRTGPPMLVNAAPAKKDEKLWKESVVIEEVKYSDGSRWEYPGRIGCE